MFVFQNYIESHCFAWELIKLFSNKEKEIMIKITKTGIFVTSVKEENISFSCKKRKF